MTNRTLDTKFIFWEQQDDVMFARYKPILKIDINDAKEIVKERLAFFDGKKYKLVIMDQGVRSLTKEARDYLSSEEGCRDILATAFILKSEFSRLLANFIIKVTRPSILVKIFVKESEALKWLKTIEESEIAQK